MNKLIYLLLFLLISGCSTFPLPGSDLVEYNPQNFQGCTVAEYSQPVESETGGEAFTMRWWGCQDKASISATLDLNNDGVPDFSYSASDVVGSTSARLRAEVEKVFSDNAIPISTGAIDALVNIMSGAPAVP